MRDRRASTANSGLVIRSADIARQVTSLLDDISADGSYQLVARSAAITSSGRAAKRAPNAVWHTDPETTHVQRFLLKLLAPFAGEELL